VRRRISETDIPHEPGNGQTDLSLDEIKRLADDLDT
jgi:hypothetical protein